MIGTKLTDRDRRRWTVVGQDGRWVISPDDGTEAPRRVAAGELAQEFQVDGATDPAPVAEDGAEGSVLARFGARVIAAGRASSGWGDLADAHAEADAQRRLGAIEEDDG